MANGNADGKDKFWSLSNLIITAMSVIIGALVSAGFYSLSNKIETGDAMIYSQIAEIKREVKGTSDELIKIRNEVVRIDTLQKLRLEREVREENRKGGR